jgi:hypothetical protein
MNVLSQILQLARQFLLLFTKGLQLISYLVIDNSYRLYVMQYIPVLSCLFFKKQVYQLLSGNTKIVTMIQIHIRTNENSMIVKRPVRQ